MIFFPRALRTCPMAMAIGVLPVPPAVRLPTHTTRALGRNGRAARSRARMERPYSAPRGASNAAMARAATLSPGQNLGVRMGDERFRGLHFGRKRTTQKV